MSDEIVKRPPPGRKSRAGLLKEIERLKRQRDGLANFNPDWDMLEATQESLRGWMKELKASKEYTAELQEENASMKAEIEMLNTFAADAIKFLTDEVGAGDDPVAFVCAAYVASRQEIDRLKAVVDAVTGGIPSEITAALAKLEEST